MVTQRLILFGLALGLGLMLRTQATELFMTYAVPAQRNLEYVVHAIR